MTLNWLFLLIKKWLSWGYWSVLTKEKDRVVKFGDVSKWVILVFSSIIFLWNVYNWVNRKVFGGHYRSDEHELCSQMNWETRVQQINQLGWTGRSNGGLKLQIVILVFNKHVLIFIKRTDRPDTPTSRPDEV